MKSSLNLLCWHQADLLSTTVATGLHSDLFDEASHFDDCHPHCATCLATVGAAGAGNHNATARSLMNVTCAGW